MPYKAHNSEIGPLVREIVMRRFKKDDPTSPLPTHQQKRARDIISYVLRESLGQTLRVTSEAIGVKGNMTIYHGCARMKELLKNDTALAGIVEEIKSEVLEKSVMSAAETSPQAPTEEAHKESGNNKPQNSKPITSPKDFEMVQQAISEVFLGPDLFSSANPANIVQRAKEVAMFLHWNDFEKQFPEISELFNVSIMDFYYAIGSVTVRMSDRVSEGELRHQIKAVRARYRGQRKGLE